MPWGPMGSWCTRTPFPRRPWWTRWGPGTPSTPPSSLRWQKVGTNKPGTAVVQFGTATAHPGPLLQGGPCRTPSPSAAGSRAGNVGSRASMASSELLPGDLCTPRARPHLHCTTQQPPNKTPLRHPASPGCAPLAWLGSHCPWDSLTTAKVTSSASISPSNASLEDTLGLSSASAAGPWSILLPLCALSRAGSSQGSASHSPPCLPLPMVPPSLLLWAFSLRGFFFLFISTGGFSPRDNFCLQGLSSGRFHLEGFQLGGSILRGSSLGVFCLSWCLSRVSQPQVLPGHLCAPPRHSPNLCLLVQGGLSRGSLVLAGQEHPGGVQQLRGVQQPIPIQVLPCQGLVHPCSHLWGWGIRGGPGPSGGSVGCEEPPQRDPPGQGVAAPQPVPAPSPVTAAAPARPGACSGRGRGARRGRAGLWGRVGCGAGVSGPTGPSAPHPCPGGLTLLPCHGLHVPLWRPQAPHCTPQQPGGSRAGVGGSAPAP